MERSKAGQKKKYQWPITTQSKYNHLPWLSPSTKEGQSCQDSHTPIHTHTYTYTHTHTHIHTHTYTHTHIYTHTYTHTHILKYSNIQVHIPKSWVLKFQNPIRHWSYITTQWNKLYWQEKSLLSKVQEPDFQKRTIK